MMYLKKDTGPSGTERLSLFIPIKDDGEGVWFQATRDNGEITMRVTRNSPPEDAVRVQDANGTLAELPEYVRAIVAGMNAQKSVRAIFEAFQVHHIEPDVGNG